MLKNLNGLATLLKNASSMGDRVKELREGLARETISGSAGGDLVKVEVTGMGEVKSLKIAPELIERQDVEMVEELVPSALNEALSKVRKLHIEKMREATGGLDLPGLEELANL